MKTIFIPVYDTTEITPLLKKSLAFLKDETSAAFFTTVQFINQLPLIKKFYKKHNIKIEFLSSIKKTSQQGISSKFSSQILGCDATAAKKAKSREKSLIYDHHRNAFYRMKHLLGNASVFPSIRVEQNSLRL